MGYMDMKDRIERRRKELGLSQERLAELVGMSQPGIRKIIKGGRTRKILELAGALRCSPEWLQTGAGSPGGNVESVGPASHLIPLIGWVAASEWCESPDEFAPGDAEEWLPKPSGAGDRSFALRVVNDSMRSPYPGERSYPPGIVIYVDPDRAVTTGCRVVARAGGEYTFKQYVEDSGKSYLKPINPQYPILEMTDEVHICGVVIGSYMTE